MIFWFQNKIKDSIKSYIFYIFLTLLLADFFILGIKFYNITHKAQIRQIKYGVEYIVKNSESGDYILVIWDLLWTNKLSEIKSREYADEKSDISYIVVPSLNRSRYSEINEDNFLDAISSDSDVILPDNFCIRDWDKIKGKKIYSETNLTPGPYCQSEPQTQLLVKLLLQYKPRKAILLYDVKWYIEQVGTFTEYLDENKIDYEFLSSK
ncbi:MAG: hypothetical protein ACD_2C00119G0002 [uncultured bacterium (gcode 4)]|uniref:Uncharacterized protein n=1 Tax=uncultured bacterium (gcode 4) TaxID=1234023 RepID=K2FER9_9BACT|nr:MAG: hypothetical protein ACD_2C00119G0002 [uncultured bacterium (gcode 4)]